MADPHALLVAGARLLDVHVDVAHGGGDPERLVAGPARVGVPDERVARLQLRAARLDPQDVRVRVPAELQLEPGDALLRSTAVNGRLTASPVRYS